MADLGKKTTFTEGTIAQQNQGLIGGAFKQTSNSSFLDERCQYFDSIYEEQQKLLSGCEKPEITITLKDGKQLKGRAFETTPLIIATGISKKLAENVHAAKITYTKKYENPLSKIGQCIDPEADENIDEEQCDLCCDGETERKFEVYDLTRPLEGDCQLELVDFEDPLGKQVFWHSSAHILGQSIELIYGAHLCIGPALSYGFFYDSYMGECKITQSDYKNIEKTVEKTIQEKQNFQKVYLTKAQALELFRHNPFKVQLITNKIPENAITTAYKCGKLIDLCTGPHLPNTGRVKAFKVLKNSSAYWLGKKDNDILQRVYGISFPSKKQLEEYVKIQEELAKRDHRNIGKQQELFTFHQFSPGCTFFYPNGACIYNKLMEVLRQQYLIRGYSEVISPNLYDSQLWKISGHWTKYKENMFLVNSDNEIHGLKPMNCPGHCLIFDSVQRSYRDLPLRYADFGVLHRNEVHGALSGLTRVRRFQQDDAHIFCTMDQIMEEIKNALDFIDYIYSIFGFEYTLALSTRPECYLGEKEQWDQAENSLREGLNAFGKHWTVKHGDGAFYGPKIDIQLYDAFKRGHQCGTIQLDFNLPIRFNLQYRANESKDEIEQQRKKQEQQSKQQGDDNFLLPEEKQELKIMEQEIVEEKKNQDGGHQDLREVLRVDKKSVDQQNNNSNSKLQSKDAQFSQDTQHSHQNTHQSDKKYVVNQHHLKLGFQRPVILHRAVIGSFERFLAILCEQTAGKWPFWLSPKQVIICSIVSKVSDFCESIKIRLKLEGFQAYVDVSECTLNKKVRNAQLEQFNYIAVVGEEEKKGQYVDLRERDKQERIGKFSIDELIAFFKSINIPPSKAEQNQWNKAFKSSINEEFKKIDNILQNQVFLQEEGFELGDIDVQEYQKIKNQHIDSKIYPNLHRWFKFVQKKQESK